MIPINKSVKELQGILPKPKKSLTIEAMDEIIRSDFVSLVIEGVHSR